MDPKDIPFTQRALVLQGGGALGAYAVGILKVLFKEVAKESKSKENKDLPLFDVIAGTSIGAINAAVLIGNVVNRNKTWEQALEQLEIFGQMRKKVYHLHQILASGGGLNIIQIFKKK